MPSLTSDSPEASAALLPDQHVMQRHTTASTSEWALTHDEGAAASSCVPLLLGEARLRGRTLTEESSSPSGEPPSATPFAASPRRAATASSVAAAAVPASLAAALTSRAARATCTRAARALARVAALLLLVEMFAFAAT